MEADFNFLFRYVDNIQKDSDYVLLVDLNSLNNKFEFLTVQNVPGGLLNLNLEVDFNFFFRFDNSIQKDAYSVL